MNNFDSREIIKQFLATIIGAGIKPRDYSFSPLIDGKLHRFPIEGDKGSEKSGGYCVYTDKRPAGWAKDFRQNITVKFRYDLSDEEKREYAREMNDAESRAKYESERKEAERRKAEERRLHEKNQQQARRSAWQEYLYTDLFGIFRHQYLKSRFIDLGIHIEKSTAFNSWDRQTPDEPENYHPTQRFPIGISRVNGSLIVPLLDVVTGEFRTLIRIPPTRNSKGGFDKHYYTGLSPTGAAHFLTPKYSEYADTVLPCEGIATAISLLVLTGEKYQIYSAGGCGNLLPVCTGLRKRFPKKKICIMADNDEAGIKAAKQCITAGVADDYRYPPNYKEDFYDFLARKVKH